jgi:hypothetical protein
MRGNYGSPVRIDLGAPAGRKKTMRWKISHDHDPRLNDLVAILALHPDCRRVALFRYALRTAKPGGLHRAEPKRAPVKSGF